MFSVCMSCVLCVQVGEACGNFGSGVPRDSAQC